MPAGYSQLTLVIEPLFPYASLLVVNFTSRFEAIFHIVQDSFIHHLSWKSKLAVGHIGTSVLLFIPAVITALI